MAATTPGGYELGLGSTKICWRCPQCPRWAWRGGQMKWAKVALACAGPVEHKCKKVLRNPDSTRGNGSNAAKAGWASGVPSYSRNLHILYIYIYIEGSPLYMQNNAKLEICEMSLLLCSFALRDWRFDTLLKREYVDAALWGTQGSWWIMVKRAWTYSRWRPTHCPGLDQGNRYHLRYLHRIT